MRKNKIKICCMMLIMTINLLGNISLYVEEVVAVDTSIKDVIHRADEIGWKYKKIREKWYKRLYNYTKKCWVGEWIPV